MNLFGQTSFVKLLGFKVNAIVLVSLTFARSIMEVISNSDKICLFLLKVFYICIYSNMVTLKGLTNFKVTKYKLKIDISIYKKDKLYTTTVSLIFNNILYLRLSCYLYP